MKKDTWLADLIVRTVEEERATKGVLYPITFLFPNKQYTRSVMHQLVVAKLSVIGVRFETFSQYLHRTSEQTLLRTAKEQLNTSARDFLLRKILQTAKLEYFTAASTFADSYGRYFGRVIGQLQANLEHEQILSLAREANEPAVRDVVAVYRLYRTRIADFADYGDLLGMPGKPVGTTVIFPAFSAKLSVRERAFVAKNSEKVAEIELPAKASQPKLRIQNPVHARDEVRAVLREIQSKGLEPSSILVCAPPQYHDLFQAEAAKISVPVRAMHGQKQSFYGAAIVARVIDILEEDFPFGKLRELLLLRKTFGQLKQLYDLQVALGEKQLIRALETASEENGSKNKQNESLERLYDLVKRLCAARNLMKTPQKFVDYCLEHFVTSSKDRNILSVILGDLLQSAPETEIADLRDYLDQLAESLAGSSGTSGVVLSADVDAGFYDHVYVLGMTDHGFPVVVKEDPILPDALRARINEQNGAELPLARDKNRQTAFALSHLIGAAGQSLVASFPTLNLGDDSTERESFYLVELAGKLSGNERMSAEEYARLLSDTRMGPEKLSASECLDDEDFLLRLRKPQEAATYFALLAADDTSFATFHEAEEQHWGTEHNERTGLIGQNILKSLLERGHYFSATSDIEKYMSCPYRWFLSRLLRLKALEEPTAAESMDALQKGSLVHEILHRYLEQKTRTRKRLGEIARKCLDEYVEAHGSLHKIMVEKVETEVAEMLDTFWQFESSLEALPPVERQEAEFEFGQAEGAPKVAIKLGKWELSLNGSIDRFDVRPDEILLLDYKTGKRQNYKLEKATMAEKIQPWLYAEVLRNVLPAKFKDRPIKTGYLALKDNAKAEADVLLYDDAKQAELLDLLGYIADGLAAGFTVQTAQACGDCEYQTVCGNLVVSQCGRKDPTVHKKPVQALLARYQQLSQKQ